MLRVAAAMLALCASAGAQQPEWAKDRCAGLDCDATWAGVGRADLLPDLRISSAVAYAQATRSLSTAMASRMSMNERLYAENRGQAADSVVKDLAESPLGSALMKSYGGTDSDVISVAIQTRSLPDGVRAFAQEYVDPEKKTLFVRLAMHRGKSGQAPPGFSPYRGRRVRMSSQDVRVGKGNEFTLWVEDIDAKLTWVEHWPTGGADLLQDGQTSVKYVYDKLLKDWVASAAPSQP